MQTSPWTAHYPRWTTGCSETEVELWIACVKQDVDDKTLKILNYNKKEKMLKQKLNKDDIVYFHGW